MTADELAAQNGAAAWRAPNILSWQAWTGTLWQNAVVEGLDTRVLLNELQENCVWQAVIQSFPGDTLRPIGSQADLCQQTMRLLGSHDVQNRFGEGHSSSPSASDAAAFRRFYRRFEETCQRDGYLSSSHLERELVQLLQQRLLRPAPAFWLHGFSHLTPSQRALVEALQQSGAVVHESAGFQRQSQTPRLVQCGTPRAELQQCARWVRDQLENSKVNSIAIVASDLDAVRGELERELCLAVAPELADVSRPLSAPYEFTRGRPLRTLPLVRDALTLLRWCAGEVKLDDAGALLRSRHLSLTGSPETGAILDETVLRRRPGLRKVLSLRQAAHILQAHHASTTLASLEQAAHRYRTASNTYAHFTDAARTLLQVAGWPGPEVQNRAELQAIERWERLLDQVATLDLLGHPTSFAQVLDEVEALAEQTLFTQETLGRPIQIMNWTEALGSTAEAMWFLSCSSVIWPPRSAADPLLPLSLQRDLQMPGTDEQRDEQRTAKALAQLTHAMGRACFSYSASPDGELPQPASLIQKQVHTMDGSWIVLPETAKTREKPALDVVKDDTALPPLPLGQTAGGVSVLTAQSQCGFRAWAEKRLFTTPREAVEDGLSPRERGDQVHAVLEHFWKEAKDQNTLRRLSRTAAQTGGSERDELVRSCIAAVCRSGGASAWDQTYLRVQQRRLFHLVSAWLDLEETRPPFQVLQVERSVADVPVGPLRLRLRVDRVDEVAVTQNNEDDVKAHGIVLIDYKTGAASRNAWLGARPEQPQLPAYAVSAAQAAGLHQVDGIAFAVVRPGVSNTKLDGLATPGLLPNRGKGADIEFAEQRALWELEIEKLATDFADGDAAVAPRTYPKTCETCSQRIFCRVNPATQWEEDDETIEEEAALW